jgi:hypothetical protein
MAVHQPEAWIAVGSRKELISRASVGMLQRIMRPMRVR